MPRHHLHRLNTSWLIYSLLVLSQNRAFHHRDRSQLCWHAGLQELGMPLARAADPVQVDGVLRVALGHQVSQDLANHAAELEAVPAAGRAQDDLRRQAPCMLGAARRGASEHALWCSSEELAQDFEQESTPRGGRGGSR